MGSRNKKYWEAVKRLDRLALNLAHIHVDSSGNGYTLNTGRPSITQGAFRGGGGLEGRKFKSLGKLSNGCTDLHKMWYTSADLSGNGHMLNTIRPSIPQGAFL